MAAFGAPRIQYLATTPGGHTGTKAVVTRTLQAAGLESTFHDRDSDVVKKAIVIRLRQIGDVKDVAAAKGPEI